MRTLRITNLSRLSKHNKASITKAYRTKAYRTKAYRTKAYTTKAYKLPVAIWTNRAIRPRTRFRISRSMRLSCQPDKLLFTIDLRTTGRLPMPTRHRILGFPQALLPAPTPTSTGLRASMAVLHRGRQVITVQPVSTLVVPPIVLNDANHKQKMAVHHQAVSPLIVFS